MLNFDQAFSLFRSFILFFLVGSFDCGNTNLDIAFVIPSREAVGSDSDYNTMIQFVEDLASAFSVVRDRSHIAVGQFAKKSKIIFPLNEVYTYETRVELSEELNKEVKGLGIGNYIYNALQLVTDDVFQEGKNRADALDVIIAIANKRPTDKDQVILIQLSRT